MKIVKIVFKNAKLFPNSGKDFVSEFGIRSKRNDENKFIEPITVHQISNMLHKMMGERPVPSFRYVGYKRQSDIFELAKKSRLLINSLKVYDKKNKKYYYFRESIQIKKSVNDSWNKQILLFWDKIRVMFGDDDKYNEFILKLSKILGYNVLSKPFLDYKLCCDINDENFKELFSWLKILGKMSIVRFLTDDKFKDGSGFQSNKYINETVSNAFDATSVLSGVIYVPIPDNMLKRFVFSNANILDGGLATIEGVYYEEDLFYNNSILVSEISDEKGKNINW